MQKIELVEFIDNLIHEFHGEISLNSSHEKIFFHTHPYWLEICIKNILENALKHGAPPIKISLLQNGGITTISIEDHGNCQFTNLDDITTEYRKGSYSEGTGLGMSIVKKALSHLQGKLAFTTAPTTFTLHFNQEDNK